MKKRKNKSPAVNFLIVREYLGRSGLWNPRINGKSLKGGLQLNIFSDRKGYLELAEFIKKFAKLDTSHDPQYHEHFEDIMSVNGDLRLHIILRKDDIGDSIWSDWFPRKKKQKNKTHPTTASSVRAKTRHSR
jgi:hypothetical protein